MVEGAGRGRNDHSNRGVYIGHHVPRRQAAQAIAVAGQKPIALAIERGLRTTVVRFAIDLDAKPG